MASKKKGSIVIKKNGLLKVTYSHRNSEMRLVGRRVVNWIRTAGIDAISDYYDKVQMVREEDPMTKEQIESYKRYMPEQLWKDDLTWPEAMAYTKDAVAPLVDFYPYMVDYAGFVGAWVNRWRYIIDLDNNLFLVIRAGLEIILQREDEYAKDLDWFPKMAHCEIGRFPLDNIPEDWIEQCDRYWKTKIMICAVDFTKNSESMNSKEIQSHSKNGYNPYDYEWDKIKFFYGQNHFTEMISDMK